jgi:signal transduction histidine kinase
MMTTGIRSRPKKAGRKGWKVTKNAHANNGSPESSRRELRVLFVEDSQIDAALIIRTLERGGFETICERVDNARALEETLNEGAWDLVLADHSMPDFSAPEALAVIQRQGRDIPFIIVSGHIDEDTAVQAMKAGAHDYIMKDRLARLLPAVERELREAEVRRARAKSEAELRCAHEELEARVERRTADLKEANRKLENVIEERKRLENELLEIAENERRRIGFDLHDDLGQKLTGVSLMAKGLEIKLSGQQHPCADQARKIQALLEEITQRTHDLARNLSSIDAQGDDAASVLTGLAGNVEQMFAIRCECIVKGNVPVLPQHTTVQLYKISQEAVSNSIKHGRAKRVSITLAADDSEISLTIRNDGVPFSPPADPNKRMGLRIMNYRASTIGATLEIRPLNENGTILTCLLPLTKEAPAEKAVGTTVVEGLSKNGEGMR